MDARIYARVHEKASGFKMIESGQHVVYGLISPRAGWLFYVGITSNLNRRLSQHRSSHNICASRAVVLELEEDGQTFDHCVFGVFDDKDEALKLEAKLIYGIPDVVNFRGSTENCGGAHPAYECRKKSTAARMDVHDMRTSVSSGGVRQSTGSFSGASRAAEPAGTQALPVDTNSEVNDMVESKVAPARDTATTSAGTVGNKDRQTIPKRGRGRPRTITDMASYKAMKQREYRARKKNEA